MMESTLKLGKVFGIPIGVHYTWFFVFAMLTFLLSDGMSTGAKGWLLAGGTALIFFASVLAHELSHSVVAMARGIPVRGITLFIFGGVAQIAREAKTPMTEFLVAIAGPLCSLALAGVFYAVRDPLAGMSRDLVYMASSLALFNLMVGVFNLVPGFPMDGGRVFRALVWALTHSYQTATKVAIRAGQGIAILMIAFGSVLVVLHFVDSNQVLWTIPIFDFATLVVAGLWNGLWTIFIGFYLGSPVPAARGPAPPLSRRNHERRMCHRPRRSNPDAVSGSEWDSLPFRHLSRDTGRPSRGRAQWRSHVRGAQVPLELHHCR